MNAVQERIREIAQLLIPKYRERAQFLLERAVAAVALSDEPRGRMMVTDSALEVVELVLASRDEQHHQAEVSVPPTVCVGLSVEESRKKIQAAMGQHGVCGTTPFSDPGRLEHLLMVETAHAASAAVYEYLEN